MDDSNCFCFVLFCPYHLHPSLPSWVIATSVGVSKTYFKNLNNRLLSQGFGNWWIILPCLQHSSCVFDTWAEKWALWNASWVEIMSPAWRVTCSTRHLTPCARRHLEPEIWKRKVLDWNQRRENHHLLGHKHAWWLRHCLLSGIS